MEDIKEFLDFLGLAFLLIGIIGGVTCLAVYGTDKYITTPQFGKSVQKPVKYNFWAGGCFVQLENGQWVSCENYKGVRLEK